MPIYEYFKSSQFMKTCLWGHYNGLLSFPRVEGTETSVIMDLNVAKFFLIL
jgi:hypothetical protein